MSTYSSIATTNTAEQNFAMLLMNALRPLEDAEDIKAAASRILGQYLQADRVVYFEVTAADYVIERDYTRHVVSLNGRHPMAAFGTSIFDKLQDGQTAVDADIGQNPQFTAGQRSTFTAIDIGAYVGVPLVKAGIFVAGLGVHQAQPRAWTLAEVALVEETAERTWAAVERARSARQLKDSERLRRMALEAAGLGVWSVSPIDNTLTTDDQFRMIFHGSTDALTYEAAINAVHPDDSVRNLAAIEAAMRVHEPLPYKEEYRVTWPDGSLHWVSATGRGHIVSSPQGPCLESFDGTVKDITKQKLAQKQTRENEQRAGLLFDAMNEGALIIEMILDGNGRPADYTFLHVNAAFERLCGLKDAVGRTVRQLVPHVEQHWIDFYGCVALTGQSEKIQQTNALGGGRWWDVSAYQLGGAGSLKVAALFTDVTERKNIDAIKAAAEQRERLAFGLLKAVADGSSDSIAAMDTDLRFTFVNSSYQKTFFSLFGVQALVGNRLDETLAHLPEEQANAVELWQRALRERFVVDAEFGDATIDRRSFNICSYPLKDFDGRVIGAAQNAADNTELFLAAVERERLMVELQEQDQRKDEFLAMLSHELRNPLAPISNAVQLLRLHAGEDARQLQSTGIIERQVDQLKRLVDDLLEVSRITTGRIQLRQDRVTLNGIVYGAVETTSPQMVRRQHEVVVKMPEQPLWLLADAARLEQVLVNLLVNAAKYSNERGRISITAEQHGLEAVLRVEDTGFGIAPELLPRVFDLFTQADRSLARSEGGLGIGLALVKRLVELHGGRVEVSSTFGRGSEFVVRLPAATAGAPSQASDTPRATVAPTVSVKRRVLVVDDNIDAAETSADLLQLYGHEVRAAHDGLSALKIAFEWQPAVVLLDIGLPGMDGFEVARRIRAQPLLANVVLVAITGYGHESDLQRAKAAGFDHHLTKPADFVKIQEILSSE